MTPPAVDKRSVGNRSHAPTRLLRVISASIVVALLTLVICAGGLFFLLRGAGIENGYLNRKIQSAIEARLGPDFKLDIGRATVGFGSGGLLRLNAKDVNVTQAGTGEPVSHIGNVTVGVGPFSLLFGNPRVDSVLVEDSAIDAAVFSLPVAGAVPSNMAEAVTALRDRLAELDEALGKARFNSLRFANVKNSTAVPDAFRHELVRLGEAWLGAGRCPVAGALNFAST